MGRRNGKMPELWKPDEALRKIRKSLLLFGKMPKGLRPKKSILRSSLDKKIRELSRFEEDYIGLSYASATEGIYFIEAINPLRVGDLFYKPPHENERTSDPL